MDTAGGFGPSGSSAAGGAGSASVPLGAGTVGNGLSQAPVTELGGQAGFLDTLRNAGLGQALSTGLPGDLGSAGAAGSGLLGGLFGNSSLASLLGKGLEGYFGYQSAQDAADRAGALDERIFGLAEQDRADRLPFINKSHEWLDDPRSLATSPWGQEIARQTARSIGGSRQENLFDNPTGQSLVMQSLLPQALNAVTQIGNLGLRNTAPLGDIYRSGLNSAQAAGAPSAVLGSTFGDIFNSTGMSSQNDVLRKILAAQSNPNQTRLM